MKNKILVFLFLFLISSITFSKQRLEFKLIEKTNDNIKIVINSTTKIKNQKNLNKKLDTYTVKKGDTLASISKMNKIPIIRILELNNIKNENKIYINQKLILEKN